MNRTNSTIKLFYQTFTHIRLILITKWIENHFSENRSLNFYSIRPNERPNHLIYQHTSAICCHITNVILKTYFYLYCLINSYHKFAHMHLYFSSDYEILFTPNKKIFIMENINIFKFTTVLKSTLHPTKTLSTQHSITIKIKLMNPLIVN